MYNVFSRMLHLVSLREKPSRRVCSPIPCSFTDTRLFLDLWLMPLHRMHLTTLEVTHSRTPEEIASLVSRLRPALPHLTNLTFSRRSRLVKPQVSYDLSAFALSFLPAAGERIVSPGPRQANPTRIAKSKCLEDNSELDDTYTYHHLRRDVFSVVQETGVDIGSRYVVPSAHITLGRYLSQGDHATDEMRECWVQTIDDINRWLENEVWEVADGEFIGEWIVGQERGLDARSGTLWYGGGRTISLGEGF